MNIEHVLEFSILRIVQTGSEAHSACFPKGIGDSFPGANWLGREANHSPRTMPKSRKRWSIYSPPKPLKGAVLN
jgi:hypothetical protein